MAGRYHGRHSSHATKPTQACTRPLSTDPLPDVVCGKGRRESRLQDRLFLQHAERLNQPGDDPCPSGLMAGADSGAVVAVKILEEQQAVAPMRIGLETLGA